MAAVKGDNSSSLARKFGLLLALLAAGSAGAGRAWAQAAPRPPAASTVYVSREGNDAWSGARPDPNRARTDGPFATLEHARDALRLLRASEKTIEVRAGIYPIAATFALTAADSGLTIRAYPGEVVRLQGGQRVQAWTPVTDPAIRNRLDPAVRGHVIQTDLRALGIADVGQLTARGFGRPDAPAPLELFWNDQPMTIARWPNGNEWATIAATPAGQNGGRFTYSGDRPSRWKADDNIWLHGYWTFDWADSYERVASLNPATHEIVTAPPHGAFGYTPGKRWYALNVLEELDAPGEYYVDSRSGALYFYPPPGRTGSAVVSTLAAPLITVAHASRLTLNGLTIEDGRAGGIQISNSDHTTVQNCIVRNLGNSGIEVSGGNHCTVSRCQLYGLGDKGIDLSGGDRLSLTSCDNEALNCDIHDYSRWDKTYRAGVNVDGVGIRVAHCHIHDAPHNAILLSGNDDLIEYNEIDHVCEETGDAGAFYMGRDWTMRGVMVRGNWFHDLSGVKNQSGFTDVMAVYLDDCASGTLVVGNIFERIQGRAIMVGGGRDDKVRNNLFVDCRIAVHVDARAQGWAKNFAAPGGGWEMQKKLAYVRYDQPPYSTRYPELAAMKTDDDTFPRGTEVVGNVIAESAPLDARWLVLQDGLTDQKIALRNNSVIALANITAPKNKPATLNPDTTGIPPDFPPLATDQIGIQK